MAAGDGSVGRHWHCKQLSVLYFPFSETTPCWKGQLPQARVAAAERKEGVMRRVIGLMAACLGFIAAIMLIFWIMGGFGGGGGSVSVSGWIAFAIGATLTSVLGVGLMALVFYSDRSGRDEAAGEMQRELDRSE
jgi:hypothetical protein